MDEVFTKEMLQKVIDAMKPPDKMIALNPYVRLPADNEMTVAEEKEAGTLPGNIILSKAVPLLTAYEFDRSLLEFPPIDEPKPQKVELITTRGIKLSHPNYILTSFGVWS